MIRHYVYFGDGPLPSPSPALFIYPLWVYQCPIDIRSFSLLFNRKRICIPIYLYCILFYCSIVPIFHLINFFFFASFHIFFFFIAMQQFQITISFLLLFQLGKVTGCRLWSIQVWSIVNFNPNYTKLRPRERNESIKTHYVKVMFVVFFMGILFYACFFGKV